MICGSSRVRFVALQQWVSLGNSYGPSSVRATVSSFRGLTVDQLPTSSRTAGNVATAPTVTTPCGGHVYCRPHAVLGPSDHHSVAGSAQHHVRNRLHDGGRPNHVPFGARRHQLCVHASILRLDRALAIEGFPVEPQAIRIGGHNDDLSIMLAKSNRDRAECGGAGGAAVVPAAVPLAVACRRLKRRTGARAP